MFNECFIHLCDYTWLNVLYILNQLLIKHKKILEYFYLFLECILFWKILENPKIFATLFWRFSCRSSKSRDPSRELTQMLLRLSGESVPQSRKIIRKFSKFLGFWHFHESVWLLGRKWKLQSWAYIDGFVTPFAICFCVDFLVAKNT